MTRIDGRVTFVVTHGTGSLDVYAQKVAAHLPTRKLHTETYRRSARVFVAPLISRASVRALWNDASFVSQLRREEGPLHLPNHHCGRYGRFLDAPYVITVHDLMRLFDLDSRVPLIDAPGLRQRVLLRLDAAGIRKATGVIAVSETTKRDLVRHLAVPEDRIAVVYEGVDHARFRPVPERPVDFPYLLFVGSEQPRKNLAMLLRAFRRIKRTGSFPDLKLVKVGSGAGNGDHPFRARTLEVIRDLGLEEEVILTGRLAEEQLPAYYSAAELFVLPSLYEGFGLPPLEAMACGCPVVVSNRGALPETAGPGALVVDPADETALAAAIEKLLRDGSARDELRERGLRHAAAFSWRRCAEETLAAYDRFL